MSNAIEIKQAELVAVFYDDSHFKYAMINKEGEIGTWLPGTPEAFEQFVVEKTGEIPYGEIPEGVKYLEPKGYTIIFETKECIKEINTGSESKNIKFPHMLWVYSKYKRELHLYKIIGKHYYPIKFANVSEGNVCIGTSPHPTSFCIPKLHKQIQEMFFDGKFASLPTVKRTKQKYTWTNLLKHHNI